MKLERKLRGEGGGRRTASASKDKWTEVDVGYAEFVDDRGLRWCARASGRGSTCKDGESGGERDGSMRCEMEEHTTG